MGMEEYPKNIMEFENRFNEVYSLLNGSEAMEVISSSELEITERGTTSVAEYNFKGDKLRVVASIMGTKQVQYYLLTKEGLEDEKTGKIYYSKAALAVALERRRAEAEKRKQEAEERRKWTDNGNGTITHNVTGLMWQKEDDDTTREWESAITYCEGLSLGGHKLWKYSSDKYVERFLPIKDLT